MIKEVMNIPCKTCSKKDVCKINEETELLGNQMMELVMQSNLKDTLGITITCRYYLAHFTMPAAR